MAVWPETSREILGYYTASMAQVVMEELPGKLKKGLHRYPVPAMRIGRLAVDLRSQGKGIGRSPLRDAFLRALSLSAGVGTYCLLVDA